jgi:hypothetical protein
MADDQFQQMAGAVAREFLGEPNKALSKQNELRFGTNGSMSVDLEKGTFFDHGEDQGGGVLWFVESQTGKAGGEAVAELRSRGFDVEDNRSPMPGGASDYDGGGRDTRGGAIYSQGTMRPVAEWDYRDADGKLLFQVVRMEDGTVNDKDGKRNKSYRQRRPDESKPGGWDWKTKGMTMVPYRLPEVIKAIAEGQTVYIVEGEKAADRLWQEGVPATTNARGAGKWTHELNPYFAGARVVVLPDIDPQSKNSKTGELLFHDNGDPKLAGQDHGHAVAGYLEDIAKDVRYVELPDVPLKGDVVDWLDGGGDIDQLYDLSDAAPRYEAQPFRSAFHAVTWGDMDLPGPEHEWLIKGILTRNELSMVAGPSKSGKSFLVLDIALAIARGIPWFGKKCIKGGVIYQAGEGATGIKKRVRAYRDAHELRTQDDLPFVLLPSRVDLYNNEDHTDQIINEILHWKKAFSVPLELIIIDTWATATPGANENDGKDVSIVLERCSRINRDTGAAVLLVHHMNADGGKVRGHTSILANLENVLIVKQIEDHHDADGRQVREAKVDKNKDGEGNQSFKFVLRGVQIGVDEDGDAVTSCVVKQPDGTGTDYQQQERPNVTDKESVLLRAIEAALRKHGTAPMYDDKLPSGVETIVDFKLVAEEYDKIAFDDVDEATETDDERTKRLTARRVAQKRAGEALMRKGIIGREKPYIWLTGKKVKGYRPTGQKMPTGGGGYQPQDDQPPPQGDWTAEDFAG